MNRFWILLFTFLLSACVVWAQEPLPQPLRLPPGGVEVLAINKEASYFGDVIRVVNCPKNEDNPLGTCGNVLFGGFAVTDSHISGLILIKFFPPVNDISHFEISHPSNLVGDSSVLTAPQLYQFAIRENFVLDAVGQVSSGDLNLVTGEVKNFDYRVIFFNDFYNALASANPRLRGTVFKFPGGLGILKVNFQQRADGLLDLSFYTSTFLPLGNNILGDPVRFPLPLCGPLAQCASIDAPGTALHPHIRISTLPISDASCGTNCPDIPFNTVREYSIFSRNTTFGDNFALNVPQLGTPATAHARSHLQGRIQIQFGEASGTSVPFVIRALAPAGLIGEPPVKAPFPGISLGSLGFSEFLQYPKQLYFFERVFLADDPFLIAAGSIDLRTRSVIGGLVYPSFFNQSIFEALLRINPGIAAASQQFLGPAVFEKDTNGQTVFRYNGALIVQIAGILFPSPDFTTGFLTLTGSELHLFYRIQAMDLPTAPNGNNTGSGSNIKSSIGDTFSYSYSIPCLGGKDAAFQYTNSATTEKGGTFKMQTLASAVCHNSRNPKSTSGYDTISFTGFGTWSKDSKPHLAIVQISLRPDLPYVAILIDGGFTSQSNTRPLTEAETLP
jgi:hypothetical protein